MTVEELGQFGMERMDDEEIGAFLANEDVGVLGLPADGPPSMRPLSFGFDGDARLYLFYLVGVESRKAALTDRAELARFLVYRTETLFSWRSVLLTGTVDRLPESERERALAALEDVWRPDLFETAGTEVETVLYRFDVEERVGIKHVGLSPGFERQEAATDGE